MFGFLFNIWLKCLQPSNKHDDCTQKPLNMQMNESKWRFEGCSLLLITDTLNNEGVSSSDVDDSEMKLIELHTLKISQFSDEEDGKVQFLWDRTWF